MLIFARDWNAIDASLISLKKLSSKMKKRVLNIERKKFLRKENKIQWIKSLFKKEMEIIEIIILIKSFKIITETIEDLVEQVEQIIIINKTIMAMVTAISFLDKDQIQKNKLIILIFLKTIENDKNKIIIWLNFKNLLFSLFF